jgi:hypothetical protein
MDRHGSRSAVSKTGRTGGCGSRTERAISYALAVHSEKEFRCLGRARLSSYFNIRSMIKAIQFRLAGIGDIVILID